MRFRKWLYLLAALFLFGSEGITQDSELPIESMRFAYPELTPSLDLNFFANSPFRIAQAEKVELGISLKRGAGKRKEDEGGYIEVGLRNVYSLGSQYAAVDFLVTRTGGSSSNDDYLQVFKLERGHPVLLQQIRFNSDTAGCGTIYEPQTGLLTVMQTHIDPDTCIRCSGKLDVIRLRWLGDKFVPYDQTIEAAPKS
jgi:hypothetical protein